MGRKHTCTQQEPLSSQGCRGHWDREQCSTHQATSGVPSQAGRTYAVHPLTRLLFFPAGPPNPSHWQAVLPTAPLTLVDMMGNTLRVRPLCKSQSPIASSGGIVRRAAARRINLTTSVSADPPPLASPSPCPPHTWVSVQPAWRGWQVAGLWVCRLLGQQQELSTEVS